MQVIVLVLVALLALTNAQQPGTTPGGCCFFTEPYYKGERTCSNSSVGFNFEVKIQSFFCDLQYSAAIFDKANLIGDPIDLVGCGEEVNATLSPMPVNSISIGLCAQVSCCFYTNANLTGGEYCVSSAAPPPPVEELAEVQKEGKWKALRCVRGNSARLQHKTGVVEVPCGGEVKPSTDYEYTAISVSTCSGAASAVGEEAIEGSLFGDQAVADEAISVDQAVAADAASFDQVFDQAAPVDQAVGDTVQALPVDDGNVMNALPVDDGSMMHILPVNDGVAGDQAFGDDQQVFTDDAVVSDAAVSDDVINELDLAILDSLSDAAVATDEAIAAEQAVTDDQAVIDFAAENVAVDSAVTDDFAVADSDLAVQDTMSVEDALAADQALIDQAFADQAMYDEALAADQALADQAVSDVANGAFSFAASLVVVLVSIFVTLL